MNTIWAMQKEQYTLCMSCNQEDTPESAYQDCTPWSVDDLLAEFSQLFKGIGCLKDPLIHLHIDELIQPVALKHRPVAFHLRLKVEEYDLSPSP
ncbi:hypothetical protein NDU88_001956 [Pleurodeles waltl]|uniref:Uncharacterized protein n=1 Tax=Pleurodeles waltl TaxID=8319 RepID=A0AAV7T121_PLEWA|nr:hypothetical protein NDU88_001956 [Pleurodeles waltl]